MEITNVIAEEKCIKNCDLCELEECFDDCSDFDDEENDGQPSLYDEFQDLWGGDDSYDYSGDIDSYYFDE